MCPTCVVMHPIKSDIGLNVFLGDSMLHNFHHPRDPTVVCPPDPFHVYWVTISGETINDLTQAFIVHYWRQPSPMRIFVSAGLNNLLRGASRDSMMEDFIHMKEVIEAQDVYHPTKKNELTIATVLNLLARGVSWELATPLKLSKPPAGYQGGEFLDKFF